MDSLNQSRPNWIGNHISSKIFYIFLSANRSIMVTLLPQAPLPFQRLIDGQATAGFDSAHQLGQCFIPQLHQAMHMIWHHDPGQKINPTFLLRMAQLLDNQSTHSPIGKNRLPLMSHRGYQINASRL